MSPQRLQELLDYTWETFYRDKSQEIKMFKLFQQVIRKEKADQSHRPRDRQLAGRVFGKKV